MGLFKLFSRGKPAPEPVQEEPTAPAEGPLTLRITNLQGQGDRERQEDSFALVNPAQGEPRDRQGLLALVADGMGHGGRQSRQPVGGGSVPRWTPTCSTPSA